MEALYFSGAHRLLRPLIGSVGAILTLHHVRPPRADAFQPNRLLEVSPQFLEDVLRELRRSGVDIVTLDEMHRRLKEQDFRRRFVCLTFDDGYRDNARYALPVLRKYDARAPRQCRVQRHRLVYGRSARARQRRHRKRCGMMFG